MNYNNNYPSTSKQFDSLNWTSEILQQNKTMHPKNYIDWELVEEFENISTKTSSPMKTPPEMESPVGPPPKMESPVGPPPKRCHGIWEKEKNNNPIQRHCHYRDTFNYFLDPTVEQHKELQRNFLEQRRLMELKRTEAKIEEMKKKDEGTQSTTTETKRLLPRMATVFDYTTQPITVREIQRKYMPDVIIADPPFLRPIVIDGVGLLKAYMNCCSVADADFYPFPLIPFVRCLFYWISKGHTTLLCFPRNFNPISNSCFFATREDSEILKRLYDNKLALFFDSPDGDNKVWFQRKIEDDRACLITTVTQWRLQMPNYLQSGLLKPTVQYDGTRTYKNFYNYHERCERLLQPFFSHEGKWVFFSSFSANGTSVAEMIVENSVLNKDDYEQLHELQLTFIQQAKQLKILHDLLPENSRFRETSVLVKIVERLKNFLP